MERNRTHHYVVCELLLLNMGGESNHPPLCGQWSSSAQGSREIERNIVCPRMVCLFQGSRNRTHHCVVSGPLLSKVREKVHIGLPVWSKVFLPTIRKVIAYLLLQARFSYAKQINIQYNVNVVPTVLYVHSHKEKDS